MATQRRHLRIGKENIKNTVRRARSSDRWRDIRLFLNGTWYLIKSNWHITLPFLVVYSVFNMVVTSALVEIFVELALKFKGFTYIGPDNMAAFFTAPGTIIMFLLLCILVSLVHIMEISGIMHAYSMASVGKRATLKGVISAGVLQGFRSFLPQNWTIIPFIMVLIPLTGFFSLSFSSLQAAIPGFIKEFITANTLYNALYTVLYVVMLVVEVSYIFGMNFFILENSNFSSACRKSRRLIKGRYITTVLCLVIVSILFFIFVTSVSAVISSVIVKLAAITRHSLSTTTSARLAESILTLSRFLGAVIAPAVNIAALTNLFFRYVEDDNMLASLSRNSFRDKLLNVPQIAVVAAVFVALVGFNLYSDMPVISGSDARTLNRPAIAAHRGDSVNAPENTMPAFELAVLENADWAELDVFLTKDDEVVVCHDPDLKRIAGINALVKDYTYDELQQIDTGSWFSPDYSDVRISKLSDIFAVLKDKMMVQVEIKQVDSGIEEKLLKVINDCGMHDQVVIISLNDAPLRKMKELDPTIKTAYCMLVARGDLTTIPFSDYFTVEEGNVTVELVNAVHAKGSLIFAWTVNSDEKVQHLVDCGIDGILTDNPIMLRNALSSAHYTTGLARYARLYLNTLKGF